jgi:hypothetical protein
MYAEVAIYCGSNAADYRRNRSSSGSLAMLAAMRRASCASRLPHLTAHDGTVIDSELRKRRTPMPH